VPTITANGLDVAYDVHGAGPPVVMLHGATSVGREDFAAQVPLISKGFLVHLPDARGHGRTRWDAADGFEYDWLVEDTRAFVDALGLQTFHLLGFSMGAMTALQFATRWPERVRTLVVVGITTQREPRASVAKRLMDPAWIAARDPAWAAELGRRHDPGQGSGAWQRLLPAIAADVARQPLLEPADIHGIDCPAMVVCGDRDPFVPVEQAAGLARQLPDSRLFVAPDCGHEVMVRRPGLFNEALAGFYRTTEAVAKRRADPAGATAGGSRATAARPSAGTGAQRATEALGDLLTHPTGDPPATTETDARWLEGESR
jgi:pimeloyl-ACP methyl ester carboxylesterase